jgi:dTDP-4-amino-4,6-dideoxygalactose transaminase
LGLKELEKLDAHNEKRIINARILLEGLKEVKEIQLPPDSPGSGHIFVHFAIKTDYAPALMRHLIKSGIDIQTETCTNCANLNIFKEYACDCPNAEELSRKVLFLPNQPVLNEKDMKKIVTKVKEFFAKI